LGGFKWSLGSTWGRLWGIIKEIYEQMVIEVVEVKKGMKMWGR